MVIRFKLIQLSSPALFLMSSYFYHNVSIFKVMKLLRHWGYWISVQWGFQIWYQKSLGFGLVPILGLWEILFNTIEHKHVVCIWFSTPLQVQLGKNKKSMVECIYKENLLVFCRHQRHLHSTKCKWRSKNQLQRETVGGTVACLVRRVGSTQTDG